MFLTVLVLLFASFALFSASREVIAEKGWMVYLGLKRMPLITPAPRGFEYLEPAESEIQRLQREVEAQATLSADLNATASAEEK